MKFLAVDIGTGTQDIYLYQWIFIFTNPAWL